MARGDFVQALQIGATYIGTVVGAGFASGQEVLQFFTDLGPGALTGILGSTVLLFLLGLWAMRLGRTRGVITFGEAADAMLGRPLGLVAEGLLLCMLLGVTVAMVAGSGALVAEEFHVPHSAGALLAIAASAVTLLGGLRGIMAANSLIVPGLLGFVILAFLFLCLHGYVHPSLAARIPRDGAVSPWRIARAAVTYAGFNIGLSLTVLTPLGTVPARARTLVTGAACGAFGLGLLLLLLHLLLAGSYAVVARFQVPLGQLARLYFPVWLRAGFLLVLWAEIYSTLIANVYGLASEFRRFCRLPFTLLAGLILVFSFVGAQIGFSRIVSVLYPVFGYASVGLVTLLLLRRRLFPD